MRICIISYIYPRKKNPFLGIFVHAQAKELAKLGHDVEVLTTGDQDMKRSETIDGVKIKRLINIWERPFNINSPFFFLKASKRISNKKYDIVHSHFIGISTIIFGVVCKLKNIAYVVTSHGTSWEYKQGNFFKKKILTKALSFPSKIICVSKATRKILQKFTRDNKLLVINNGIDTSWEDYKINSRIKQKMKLPNQLVLLSVSDLVEKKGIDIIIKSLPRIIKKFPNIFYIIIGEGENKKNLLNLVDKLNLNDHVKFENYKKQKELVKYYSACDVFVLMSHETKKAMESFGIVYLEASYFGKPVIGGKGGGTENSVEDKKSGFLVDHKKPEDLISKLTLLLKNSKLRKEMGEYGRKRVRRNFLWSLIIKKILRVYEEEVINDKKNKKTF